MGCGQVTRGLHLGLGRCPAPRANPVLLHVELGQCGPPPCLVGGASWALGAPIQQPQEACGQGHSQWQVPQVGQGLPAGRTRRGAPSVQLGAPRLPCAPGSGPRSHCP